MFRVDSLIFRMAYRVVFLFSVLLSLYFFFRGHNLPGGGFIGGLVCALAVAVLSFDWGMEAVLRALSAAPLKIALVGLLIALAAALGGPLWGGLVQLFAGEPAALFPAFMQQYNGYITLPFWGKLHIGTPLLFDLGVFLVVVGVFLRVLFSLAQATSGETGLNSLEKEDIPTEVFVPLSEFHCTNPSTRGTSTPSDTKGAPSAD